MKFTNRALPVQPPPGRNTADWLNPRRRLYAERLLDRLRWRGGKIILDAAEYRAVRDEMGLDRFQVDGAADDLYALGVIDMRLSGRDWPVLVMLVDSIDGGLS